MGNLLSPEYRPFLLITILGTILLSGLYLKYNTDVNTLKLDYIKSSHTETIAVAKTIENQMKLIYQGLRTIARLPGVRAIDLYEKTFDPNVRISVQELYNNLYANTSLSEIYLVPINFNPENIDPNTGKLEEPITTFDELIIGQHAELDSPPFSTIILDEVEIFEYKLMKQQLQWLKHYAPTENRIQGLTYPALSGEEVLTCDNSLYSPSQPNDADRSGVVYSVPTYDINGNLKGMVTSVVLTNVLRNLLPESYYVLSNNSNSYHITSNNGALAETSASWYRASRANPELIYSEVINLNIVDSSGEWNLWIGIDNERFWNQPQVLYANRFTAMAIVATFFLVATLFFIVTMQLRQRQHVENKNIILGNEIANRTSALEESEAKFHAIVSNAADSIITVNYSGTIKTFNRAAEITFGFYSDEIIGKNIGKLIPSLINEKGELEITQYLSTAESPLDEPEELTGHHKTTITFPLEIRISEVITENDSYFIGIIRDITIRKQVEQKMMEAKNSAESSSRTKSEFLANMSHELRTPLNAIIGYSEMLHEELTDNGNPTHINDLSKIMNAGKHLLTLINNILDISKIESGKMQLYIESIDAELVIREISSTIEPMLLKNSNKLILSISANLATIQTDLTRFRQILFNLLSNANKFTKDGTVSVEADKIYIENIEHIKILVSDTGIGVAEDQIENIFEKFSQADASTTRQFGGTGLGLAITRRFCNLMNGSISVLSKKGVGTTFTVILPTGDEQLDEETRPQIAHINTKIAEAIRSPKNYSKEERRKNISKILIVDDDATVHDILQRMLIKEGFKVYSARNGEEAIQLATTIQPNLITLDIMMPNMNGWTVLRNLKSIKELADIPVIMLSMQDEKSIGKALGAADYITKPLEKNRILDRIKIHLRTNQTDLELLKKIT